MGGGSSTELALPLGNRPCASALVQCQAGPAAFIFLADVFVAPSAIATQTDRVQHAVQGVGQPIA